MKEATFTLTLLAAVVALRYAWHRLVATLAVRAGGDAVFADAETAGLSRPPLPRFDPAAEPIALFASAEHSDVDPVLFDRAHGPLRTALLRMASALGGVSPAAKSASGSYDQLDLVRHCTRRTPLPRTGAGEFLLFWRRLLACPS